MRIWIEKPPAQSGDLRAQVDALTRWAERVTEALNAGDVGRR